MNKLLIFMTILYVFLASNSFAEELKKPDDSDIESTCRTLLYQVVKERGNKEKIVVLNTTYKMICAGATGDKLDLIHAQFASIADGLAESGACLTSSGFASAGVSGGWTHREIERFQTFNSTTGGGWNHKEIERFLDVSPLIRDLSIDELNRFTALTQSGRELENIESSIDILNIQRYQQLLPQIEDLNNQLESFNNNQFNLQPQMVP